MFKLLVFDCVLQGLLYPENFVQDLRKQMANLRLTTLKHKAIVTQGAQETEEHKGGGEKWI